MRRRKWVLLEKVLGPSRILRAWRPASHRGIGKSRRGIREDAAQTPVFCWSSGWPNAGRRVGAWKKSSTRASRVGNGTDGGQFWCEPQTFMNSSGEAVGDSVDFYRLAAPWAGLLVVVTMRICRWAKLRLRPGGSSGGHHGLESIATAPPATKILRGCGSGSAPAAAGAEITDYVLGRFNSTERGADGYNLAWRGVRPGGMLAGPPAYRKR